ncbi:hypothetical protein GWW55_01920 [Campylobacter upsaliensis]|nr:hypothetical protein [Campylobacter upsaliensis]
MTKDLRKMILKAYKSLDSLGVSLHKNFYYTLGVYALEFLKTSGKVTLWEVKVCILIKRKKYFMKPFFIHFFLTMPLFFIIVVKSRVFMANIILSKNTNF